MYVKDDGQTMAAFPQGYGATTGRCGYTDIKRYKGLANILRHQSM